jgi:hypothetical protein
MTADRALWVAAKQDFDRALRVAFEVWRGIELHEQVPDDAVLQASAATILIHMTKLRNESHIVVKVPPAAATSSTTPAVSSVAVPPCPKCKGAMKDVRNQKRSEKSPDFECLQEKGDCGKPNKDKTKWFATGSWVDKLPPRNGANSQPVPAGSYDDPPPALRDESDDLPF